MIRRCVDADLPEPEFTVSSGFKTILWRPTSPQPESQPESQPNDLKSKVLSLLANAPMSKSELSENLGQKTISGQLNKVVQNLLKDQVIEYTLPDKPTSRLQKYRLTEKGYYLVSIAEDTKSRNQRYE